MDVELDRRARKTLRTRREIVRAATELVLEEGYERATITRIAERADLATRTVTTRFPSKEAIFFEGFDVVLGPLQRHLQASEGDVVDRLQAWIAELAGTPDVEDPEMRRLRSRAIAVDPDLRAMRVQHFDRAHELIAAAVAADTGTAPDSAGPQMFAAATVALFGVVEPIAAVDGDLALPELERGFGVLRGTLAALKP
ncbi:TetR family transcriptional regulator [Solirubrobacter sp. CPCC 204708]|uniref:TetR/AcrR family transcriptional regulator n=1 Tax=Solirubrobacter deserti TaxID=2282478 RepID=A0ABT4RJT9_9ACTN|nr:TetR/AcrR family transcriptional regulator [Solirubrobacter deserti]MBE2315849.1 TetR family transcriptional regulator [Solirubrobacter deserti]MDA0138814.1 TetR/AcrR family transcriptional regulator [Solirubrobacter deserti]